MQTPAIDTEGQLDWNASNWQMVNRRVRNLRQRIFKAERNGERRKVRSLQQLMLRSYSNTLQSVRRVTQLNAGKHTPGVDKVVVRTPAARMRLVAYLQHAQVWRASPVRRVFIPKQNGKLRPWESPPLPTAPCKRGSRMPWSHNGKHDSSLVATGSDPDEALMMPLRRSLTSQRRTVAASGWWIPI